MPTRCLFPAADFQHLRAKIGRRQFLICRRSPAERRSPGRPCRCRHRESARRLRLQLPDGPRPPVAIDVERQQVVHAVVVRRDLAEHPLHPLARFVDGRRGHEIECSCNGTRSGLRLSRGCGVDVKSSRSRDDAEVVDVSRVAAIRVGRVGAICGCRSEHFWLISCPLHRC